MRCRRFPRMAAEAEVFPLLKKVGEVAPPSRSEEAEAAGEPPCRSAAEAEPPCRSWMAEAAAAVVPNRSVAGAG
ncbi:MAG TPA: hypothetical protein ENK13_02025, partial [Thermopetrobacter sp.]|nr:hypothetical protein [Thermopetrobacter sp.]